VARAVEVLLEAWVQGTYGLALGAESCRGVVETTEPGGILVFDHLRQILGGPIVWAPGVEGAAVVSERGSSATSAMTSIGCGSTSKETFTSPEAAIALGRT
jgi:uncharacterized linocin/CFP29 family protein